MHCTTLISSAFMCMLGNSTTVSFFKQFIFVHPIYHRTAVYLISDSLSQPESQNTRSGISVGSVVSLLIQPQVRRLHLRTQHFCRLQILCSLPPKPPCLCKNIQIVTKHEIMLRENMAKFKKSGLECSEMLLLNESSKKMNSFTGTKVIYYAFHGCLPKELLAI